MYASFRRLDTVYSWDLRGDVTRPVQTFTRNMRVSESTNCISATTIHPAGDTNSRPRMGSVATNQRLRFDIDIGGSWLGIGDQVSVFHPEAEP